MFGPMEAHTAFVFSDPCFSKVYGDANRLVSAPLCCLSPPVCTTAELCQPSRPSQDGRALASPAVSRPGQSFGMSLWCRRGSSSALVDCREYVRSEGGPVGRGSRQEV